jgi:hypothetical protein
MMIALKSFVALVIRLKVAQDISQAGWRYLVNAAEGLSNCDGEILAIHAIKKTYLRDIPDILQHVGFKGPEAKDEADFVLVDRKRPITVSWLERVTVSPLIDTLEPFLAIKLKASQVHQVSQKGVVYHKGYDVDWPPEVGRIGISTQEWENKKW